MNGVSSGFTEIEQEFYYFMYGKSGSFTTHLFNAIFCADTINRYKLATVYPQHVQVVNDYQMETDYWDDLQSKINKSNKSNNTKDKNVN